MVKGRVKLVLFDAFDTLITPRLPIHVQYAEEAHKAGLTVDPDAVRDGFKKAFKTTTTRHPSWGRLSQPPLTADEWWTHLIEECMMNAGVDEGSLKAAMPFLAPSLLHRFESREGYKAFDDVVPALTALKEMSIPTGLVSNADSRILRTISSLSLNTLLTSPPTISEEFGLEKPDSRIFLEACRRAGVELPSGDAAGDKGEEERGSGVIMVGDELKADYHGARTAGLEARLVRRAGAFSDGAARIPAEQEEQELKVKGVRVITSLNEIVKEVRERNE